MKVDPCELCYILTHIPFSHSTDSAFRPLCVISSPKYWSTTYKFRVRIRRASINLWSFFVGSIGRIFLPRTISGAFLAFTNHVSTYIGRIRSSVFSVGAKKKKKKNLYNLQHKDVIFRSPARLNIYARIIYVVPRINLDNAS